MPDLNDEPAQQRRQALSALMDDELGGAGVQSLAEAWRGDADVRATWHSYHLIGDVLRSQDLAHEPARDETFIRRLRERLAEEPVLLAPQPLRAVVAPAVEQKRLRRPWAGSAAVAAGFVVLAGVLALSRLGPPGAGEAGPVLASAPPPVAQESVRVAAPATAVEPQPVFADGQLIRDARLDRYLAAHRQYGSSLAAPVPAASLRSAVAER